MSLPPSSLSLITPCQHEKKKRKFCEGGEMSPFVMEEKMSNGEEEMIYRARKKKQLSLQTLPSSSSLSSKKLDAIHLLKAVRGIMSVNEEIWETCKEHRINIPSASSSVEGGLRFKRIALSTIHVSTYYITKQKWDAPTTHTTLKFKTAVKLAIRNFGLPNPLPQELSSILTCIPHPDGVFPHYQQFLQNAFLLHEDVLLPFLDKFKQHLEDIHIYLGNIHTWLMEHAHLVQFVQQSFDDDDLLTMNNTSTPTGIFCEEENCKIQHEPDDICYYCNEPYENHILYSYHIDGNHQCPRHNHQHHSTHVPESSNDNKNTCSDKSTTMKKQNGSFLVTKDTIVLKCVRIKYNHRHELSFDIRKHEDRDKLTKFLAFLS